MRALINASRFESLLKKVGSGTPLANLARRGFRFSAFRATVWLAWLLLPLAWLDFLTSAAA
jgi:hypothetical protein